MTDQLVESIVAFFQSKIPNELTVFIISMLPVLELRGGLVAARLLNMDVVKAFIICYLGNMLPIPFILIFLKKIFELMKKSDGLGKIVRKMEKKQKNTDRLLKNTEHGGFFVLVAIPLPGTGGWTGALVAEIMNIKIRKSLPMIALGVLAAGLIVGAIAFGLFG